MWGYSDVMMTGFYLTLSPLLNLGKPTLWSRLQGSEWV